MIIIVIIIIIIIIILIMIWLYQLRLRPLIQHPPASLRLRVTLLLLLLLCYYYYYDHLVIVSSIISSIISIYYCYEVAELAYEHDAADVGGPRDAPAAPLRGRLRGEREGLYYNTNDNSSNNDNTDNDNIVT